MSALKFDVLDVIREPDNYTSNERDQASTAIAEIVTQARACANSTGDLSDLRAALSQLGDAA